MTPEEKAKELYDKFLAHSETFYEKEHTKQCALTCCDEMIYENNLHLSLFGRDRIKWLVQVKEEINKL